MTPTAAQASSKPSILSSDLQIEGNLTSKGSVVLHARLTGNVTGGHVTVGADALVLGDVQAARLNVDGKVHGNIAAGEVVVSSTGEVIGSLAYGRLAVQSGAFLEGDLRKSQG